MNVSSIENLRQEFDLPVPIAVWVVLTHVFVLATPLALIWATHRYADQLPVSMSSPFVVLLGSAVYIAATAFEIAQNSADRWYLTEATRSVADLFFNTLLTVAFCLFTIGFAGNFLTNSIAIIAGLIYPLAYIYNHPSARAINGVVLLLACYGLYQVTLNPTVWLFVLGNALGVYSILYLIKRRAQWIHGLAALIFGCGFLAWPLAIIQSATGNTISWALAGGFTIISIAAAIAFTPVMANARATPRTT